MEIRKEIKTLDLHIPSNPGQDLYETHFALGVLILGPNVTTNLVYNLE